MRKLVLLCVLFLSGCATLPEGYSSWDAYREQAKRKTLQIIDYMIDPEVEHVVAIANRNGKEVLSYSIEFDTETAKITFVYVDGMSVDGVVRGSGYNFKVDNKDSVMVWYMPKIGNEEGWCVTDDEADGYFRAYLSLDTANKLYRDKKGGNYLGNLHDVDYSSYLDCLNLVLNSLSRNYSIHLPKSQETRENNQDQTLTALKMFNETKLHITPKEKK